MKHFTYIFLLLAASFTLSAQNVTLTVNGRIIEENGDIEGIAYALVQSGKHFAYTDTDGYFTITLEEETEIEVSQIGYETTRFTISAEQANVVFNLASSPVLLQEVLVSGTAQYSQPQSNSWIDPAQQISQPRDVGDLFKNIPGFGLSRKGGFAVDPTFRGFKYEQLNVIYDGGTQTTYACPARMDPTTTHINPQEVQKIEIIRGPFSVRYGPTVGAVINIVTEGIPRTQDHQIHGSVQTGYETNGGSHFGQLQLYRAGHKMDFAAGGGWKDYGSYTSGDGTLIPSSFRSYDYNVKAAYRASENQQLQIGYRAAYHRDVLHVGLAMDSELDDSHFLSLDYQHKKISSLISQLKVKGYATQVDHVMTNRLRPNFGMVEARAAVEATTYGGQIELSLTPQQKVLIHAGVDFRGVDRDGNRVRVIKRNMMTGEPLPMPMTMTDAIWQDASIQQAGTYVEGRYYLDPRWTALGGLRLDYVTANAQSPAADFLALYENKIEADADWNVSATAALSYFPQEQWSLQLALGRGVRSPNMMERYINHFAVGQDAYEYVGNPQLKPEVNQQIELSTQYQANRFEAGVSVFYSMLNDYIIGLVDPTLPRKFMGNLPYARRFSNLDQVAKTGTEWNATVELTSHWQLRGTVAYVWAEDLVADEPLAEISPLTATVALRHEREFWWAQTELRTVSEQNRISESFDEQATDGFTTLDLRVGVAPAPRLKVGMAILNIFDTNYREHLNRSYRNSSTPGVILEPGRNWTCFAQYKF